MPLVTPSYAAELAPTIAFQLTSGIDINYLPIPRLLGVSSHGVLAALGIGAGLWLLVRRLRTRALPVDPVYRAFTWGIAAAFVGARADYVISHPDAFRSPADFVALWRGGLALFGGLIAGILVAVIVLRRNRVPVVSTLDAAAPAFPLAIAIGRIGDLLLTDHLGKPLGSGPGLGYRVIAGTQLAPGFGPSPAIPPPAGHTCSDLGVFYASCSYHLSAGYDLIGAVVLTALLLFISSRQAPPGALILTFGLLYSAQRLALDFTRGIDERPLLGLTGTQLLSLVLLVGSGLLLGNVMRVRRSRSVDRTRDPAMAAPPRAPEKDEE